MCHQQSPWGWSKSAFDPDRVVKIDDARIARQGPPHVVGVAHVGHTGSIVRGDSGGAIVERGCHSGTSVSKGRSTNEPRNRGLPGLGRHV